MTTTAPADAPGDAEAFIGAAERHAGKPFRYRPEIVALLSHCRARDQQQLFDDLVFNAKFVTNAMALLRRVGVDNADAAKVATELREMMERTTTLLRTLVKEMPEERRAPYLERFLAPTHGALGELAGLLGELARVKNYMLDRR